MIVETVAASSPAAGGLCPIVPAACVLDSNAIDSINPIASFWDNWFGASPADTLHVASMMVFSTPYPDFSGDWFRAVYQESGIVWIGWALATVIAVYQMVRHAFAPRKFLFTLRDYVVSLLAVSLMPMVVAGLFFISSGFSEMEMAMFGLDSDTNLADSIDASYFNVGWMSFAIRATAIWLQIEILFLMLAAVVAVVMAGAFLPLRSLDAFGFGLQKNFWRVVLLGVFVKPLMILVIALTVKVSDFLTSAPGVSTGYTGYAIVLFAIFAAALSPFLFVTKRSSAMLESAVVRMNSVALPAGVVGDYTPESYRSAVRQTTARRQAKREDQRRQAGSMVTGAILGFATGGASAAAMGAVNATSRRSRTADRLYRGAQLAREYRYRKQNPGYGAGYSPGGYGPRPGSVGPRGSRGPGRMPPRY